jgi:two-component system phosphate regulon sensor histidine kinase PhoR
MDWALANGWLLILAVVLVTVLVWLKRTHDHLVDTQHAHAKLARERSELTAGLQAADTERLALGSTATCGLLVLDRRRKIVWLNEAAQALFGEQEAVNRPLVEVVPSYEIGQVVQDAVERNVPVERLVPHKDSLWRVRARATADGRVALAVEDVTELQRLGRARRDFVANISHDLRTPIAAIQLTIETLRNGAIDNPAITERMLENVAIQTDALQQLASELFDLSQIESGRVLLRLLTIQAHDIVDPVVERLRPQAERKHLAIHVDVPDDLPMLADPDQVQKVLANLLHNAIKFTPAARGLGIAAAEFAVTDGQFSWTRSNDRLAQLPPPPDGFADGTWAVLVVWDEGPGIPPSEQSRIFERFYKGDRARVRTGETGAGLGLSIARHIVAGHGGQIWTQSDYGRGARFFFTLLVG